MTDTTISAAASLLAEAVKNSDSFTYDELRQIFTEATDLSPGDAEDVAWYVHLVRPSTGVMIQHILDEAYTASDIEPGLDRALRRLALRIANETGTDEPDD